MRKKGHENANSESQDVESNYYKPITWLKTLVGIQRIIFKDIRISLNERLHLPDHSSRKEMTNLHDHRFFLAYLLPDERLIHQYTLPSNHFY